MNREFEIKYRKKLIEVAIPLDAINAASIREKSIRQSHPSTLHLWWARRPLASARAILFCQMVDDPSSLPDEFPNIDEQNKERERLFELITEFVKWENTFDENIIKIARNEVEKSWKRCCADNRNHPKANQLFNPDVLPSFHDPFAGGGTIPLEAQRLGLETYASDLNPVSVLINKSMIEIPSRFAGINPVNPESKKASEIFNKYSQTTRGLSEDICYYGQWVRNEAEKRIGNLYPKIKITSEMISERSDLEPFLNQELKVIAWLWTRTVKSPNPLFSNIDVPLVSSFILSNKKGKETYVKPILTDKDYKLFVKTDKKIFSEETKNGTSAGKRAAFRCLMSGEPISYEYIKKEGQDKRLGSKLLAIVADSGKGRIFLSPTYEHEQIALECSPSWKPTLPLVGKSKVSAPHYGLVEYGALFSNRQLCALNTLTDVIDEARLKVFNDAQNSSLSKDERKLSDGGSGVYAYSEVIKTYLGITLSRITNTINNLTVWSKSREQSINLFSRQAIPMVWDYPEVNPFAGAAGDFGLTSSSIGKTIETMSRKKGFVKQLDAQTQNISSNKIISTDPPYYDNIAYADLSDFFYVWLRKTLKEIFPSIFATIATPKNEELVATPYLHKSKEEANLFFLNGMKKAINTITEQYNCAYPVTIYYAFKQAETKSEGTASTGWETFLEAIIDSGLSIVGTWPIRTERIVGFKKNINALASSVVLVCRKRSSQTSFLSRSEFKSALRESLPLALRNYEKSNIAPVDVAQASIGPGISIFSKTKGVLNPDDSKMSVRQALMEINNVLNEYLSKDDSEMDIETLFALTFYESFGYSERPFGDAEVLAKARNVSVEGIVRAGILESVGGKVNLIKRENLQEDWDPLKDDRLCTWEATQHLIKTLELDGETAAGKLLKKLKKVVGRGDLAATCRSLAYRLYNHCEKKNQADEARSYNSLIISWPEIEKIDAVEENQITIQTKLI